MTSKSLSFSVSSQPIMHIALVDLVESLSVVLDFTNLLKRHSFYTHYILAGIRGLETITEWASLHHERLNGRGYPFHFKGDDLSTGARAMAVADVFTATMEDRPYRKGMTPANVAGILERMAASRVLDGEIVRLMVDNFSIINEARAAAQRKAAKRYENFACLV